MSLKENIKNIFTELDNFDSIQDKYQYILELGDNIEPLVRNEKTLISGCVAQVWTEIDFREGVLTIKFDTDSLMAKGFLCLIEKVYSGVLINEIIEDDLKWVDKLKIVENLSPNRSASFYNILAKVKMYCLVYSKSK